MLNETEYYCPECDEGFNLPKLRTHREFFKAMGSAAAVAAVGSTLSVRGQGLAKS